MAFLADRLTARLPSDRSFRFKAGISLWGMTAVSRLLPDEFPVTGRSGGYNSASFSQIHRGALMSLTGLSRPSAYGDCIYFQARVSSSSKAATID